MVLTYSLSAPLVILSSHIVLTYSLSALSDILSSHVMLTSQPLCSLRYTELSRHADVTASLLSPIYWALTSCWRHSLSALSDILSSHVMPTSQPLCSLRYSELSEQSKVFLAPSCGSDGGWPCYDLVLIRHLIPKGHNKVRVILQGETRDILSDKKDSKRNFDQKNFPSVSWCPNPCGWMTHV